MASGDLETVAGWLSADTVALTGAGMSTDSGIPDYRGPNGLWTRDPKAARMSSYDDYVSDPVLRRNAWRARRKHPIWAAQPNAAHRALVDLERSGRLATVVTQNIDGLHQLAGSDPARVLELHGTMWDAECVDCHIRTPMLEELERVEAGDDDPPCRVCGGILKSATISFGQSLDVDLIQAAAVAVSNSDLLLAVGTSLAVHPAAGLCPLAVQSGARLVIINAQPTPYDDLAEIVIREPIGDVLPALLVGP